VSSQLPLFVAGVTHQHELAVVHSRARRDIALAMGQIGDQLAMTLWRGEQLADALQRHRSCSSCGQAIDRALAAYISAPLGRRPPPIRIMPVIGWVD
jgi:hypothetical protein